MKIFLLLSISIILASCSQKSCTIIVKLNSGEAIEAEYVQSFVSGVSNVKKCNGENYQTNTNNIDTITRK